MNHHICKFWLSGHCKNGDKCNWKHQQPTTSAQSLEPVDLEREAAVVVTKDTSTIPCRFFLLGNCLKEDCAFLHSEKLQGVSANGVRCTFFMQGKCFKGDSCPYLHINAPTTPEKIEYSCSICYSECGINKKKFGLLSHCDHVFCLECIRTWREKKTNSSTHTCPICRVKSYFVIPSEIYVTGEQKKEIEENYKKQLKKIPCRHFNFGKGVCPFYDQCFYVHLNEDGTPAPVIPKPPRIQRPQRFDLEFDDLFELSVSLFYRFGMPESSSDEWENAAYLMDDINSYDESEEDLTV